MVITRQRAEHLAQIETEARKLAQSGQYAGATGIQRALLARGYDTHKVFANRWTHSELDRLCDQAIRAGKSALRMAG
jgi:hypothetical protein